MNGTSISEPLQLGCGLFFVSICVGGVVCSIASRERKKAIKQYPRVSSTSINQIPTGSNKQLCYDVVIVGAGPSGATTANYLGQQGIRTALLDKKFFPRAKPCGDAWCKPALDILEELNILPRMEADGITHPVKRGGLISPFGYSCINTDGAAYGTVTGCKTYAIKRRIADEYIVRAAQEYSTVDVMEGMEVLDASFESAPAASNTTTTTKNGEGGVAGLWKVKTKATPKDDSSSSMSTSSSSSSSSTTNSTGNAGADGFITGRLLLICDGSLSYLAQKLGVLKAGTQSSATCSHAYVKGGTHNWSSADGVMMFNKAVLPGYSALFKHYNGDMYLGTYILPGGKATSRAIAPFEAAAMQHHPYIKEAFGDAYAWEEKRVVAPIRCGGIPRSFAQQLLVVGDAAGHVDPLTGEGIHTAMVAGKIAAQCCGEMVRGNNYTLAAGKAYELRCYDAFGYEFWSSSVAASLIVAMPIALDAVAVVGQRRGQAFLDFFGEVMTGVRPKSEFVTNDLTLLLEIGAELVRQVFLQYVLRVTPLIPQDIGVDLVNEQYQKIRSAAAAKNANQ